MVYIIRHMQEDTSPRVCLTDIPFRPIGMGCNCPEEDRVELDEILGYTFQYCPLHETVRVLPDNLTYPTLDEAIAGTFRFTRTPLDEPHETALTESLKEELLLVLTLKAL